MLAFGDDICAFSTNEQNKLNLEILELNLKKKRSISYANLFIFYRKKSLKFTEFWAKSGRSISETRNMTFRGT